MVDDLLRDDACVREAFRRGERRAMQSVYNHYEGLVRIIVRQGFGGFRGFRNPADQDDMIQTIFLSAFEERARLSYDGYTPYTAFLRGLAHNKIRQKLSKDQRFSRTEGAPVPSDRMSEDFEAVVIEREAQSIAGKFRDSLTDPKELAVLHGYFIEGKAEELLAKELKLTRYRVRKLIGLVHRKMEKYLKKHDVVVN